MEVENVSWNTAFDESSKNEVDILLADGRRFTVQILRGEFTPEKGNMILGKPDYDCCDSRGRVTDNSSEEAVLLIKAAEDFAKEES